MDKYKEELELNKEYVTNEGFKVSIIRIYNSRRITVQFQDHHQYVCDVSYQSLIRGSIKNPFNPTTYGIGYLGVGPYASWCDNVQDPVYRIWQRMFERCYGLNGQRDRSAYIGCSVDPVWHNFQNFAHWYFTNPDYGKGYELDKDILVIGNKTYSPSTCCLVPKEINNLFRRFDTGKNDTPGVTKHYNKFKVKFKNKHIGSFDTLDKASIAYQHARRTHATAIIERYKDQIQERVYITAMVNIHYY